MNPLFSWLAQSSIGIALFYILFRMLISRDKSHSINRFLLLGILLFSSIIPFVQIPVMPEKTVLAGFQQIQEFFEPDPEVIQPVDNETTFGSSVGINMNSGSFLPENTEVTMPETFTSIEKKNTFNPLLFIYLLVALGLFLRLSVSVISVLTVIRKAKKLPFRNYILAIVKDLMQPFSFLNHIVLSEKDYTEHREILLAHEYEHIRKGHTIDLAVVEFFTLIHWFNPLIWLLRRDLKLIHEYQADQAVLNKGIDAATYQLLVLEKAVGERRFALANQFVQKPILKRLKMMTKENKKRLTGLKLLLFIPLLLLLLQAFYKPNPPAEKGFIPSLSTETDSSKVWVERWVTKNCAIMDSFFKLNPLMPSKTSNSIDFKINENDAIKVGGFFEITDKNKHNWFIVLQNRNNDLLVENQRCEHENLKGLVKMFVEGKSLLSKNPDFEEKTLPVIGNVKIFKGIINYQKDRDTHQEAYAATFRSFAEAYLEVRKSVAKDKFGSDYFELEADKRAIVDEIVPVNVIVADPKRIGKSQPFPQSMRIRLYKDGKINYLANDYTFEEFIRFFPEKYKSLGELNVKNGYKKGVEIIVDDRKADEALVGKLSDFLKNSRVEKVSFFSKMPPPPPPPPPPVEIQLNKDGTLLYLKKVYSISEFKDILPVELKKLDEKNRRNGMKETNAVWFKTEEGVSPDHIYELKEIFRQAKVPHIKYISESVKNNSN